MFNAWQQARLKAAAATKNERTIDNVIKQLQAEFPEKFHTNESVAFRNFVNQPRYPTPHLSFIVPFPPELTK